MESEIIASYEVGAEMKKQLLNYQNVLYLWVLMKILGMFSLLQKMGNSILLNLILIQKKSISDLLPDITFDISQGGIREKSVEAEAIYKVVVLNKIFRGMYSNSIYDIGSQYDFNEMQGLDLLKDI